MSGQWQRGIVRGLTAGGRPTDACVLKVGGSLLNRPGWPHGLAELVAQQTALGMRCLLVVGGGAVVEGLRSIDVAAPQQPDFVHQLAIDLMGATARLVAEALALPLVTIPAGHAVGVLDVPEWLRREARSAELPVGWHVTSDSIAAFVAARTATGSGCELLLAKSVPPPACADPRAVLQSLARSGWVDAHFPDAAATLEKISWACPRSVPPPAVGRPACEGRGSRGGGVG